MYRDLCFSSSWALSKSFFIIVQPFVASSFSRCSSPIDSFPCFRTPEDSGCPMRIQCPTLRACGCSQLASCCILAMYSCAVFCNVVLNCSFGSFPFESSSRTSKLCQCCVMLCAALPCLQHALAQSLILSWSNFCKTAMV